MSAHSIAQFIFEHPKISHLWFKNPYLIQLSVENEDELKHLIFKLQKLNIKFSIFREPDIDNQITAIAIEPSDKTKRLVSNLPLMLKEYNIFNKIDKNTFKKEEENYV